MHVGSGFSLPEARFAVWSELLSFRRTACFPGPTNVLHILACHREHAKPREANLHPDPQSAVALPSNPNAMQVKSGPSASDHEGQVGQCSIGADQEPSPQHRVDAANPRMDQIDRGRRRRIHHHDSLARYDSMATAECSRGNRDGTRLPPVSDRLVSAPMPLSTVKMDASHQSFPQRRLALLRLFACQTEGCRRNRLQPGLGNGLSALLASSIPLCP